MKAIVFTRYGPPDVLELKEVENPSPRDGEVLIRIYATTAATGDCEIRRSQFPLWLWLPIRLWIGLRRPRKPILGQELSGEVEAVGKDVTRYKKGDRVFAATGFGLGTYAEYICLPEKTGIGVMATKPANMTYEEAAAVPVGGLEALRFLRRASIQRGEKVLIIGAGGSIGTFAVQLAKDLGAEVTGVESAGKLECLRSIGADKVIDFTKEDFANGGETYDVIFDVVGKSSFSRSLRSLRQGGRLLLANPRLSQMVRGRWASLTGSKKVVAGAGTRTTEDLLVLKELVEAGKIKSVIDRRFPLEQAAEAHRYVESGQKRGNVVMTVTHDDGTR